MATETESKALDALLRALGELDKPAHHTYKVLKDGTRTHSQCGGRWYKAGFSPCEIVGRGYIDCPGTMSRRRTAVRRAARKYAAVSEPVPVADVRFTDRENIILVGDTIDLFNGQKARVVAVRDDGMIEAVSL